MNWEYLIIHHTGAEEQDTEQVRRYHRSLGWRDIGYNYVIEKSGLVAPGRSLEIPGAHCRAGGMNTRGIGFALIGNLEEHPPTTEQVDALVGLLGRLMLEYQIPVENVLGHREVPGAATVCPGRYLPLEDVRGKMLKNQNNAVEASLGDSEQILLKTSTGLWIVQVGAFSSRERAEQYAQKLREQGIGALVMKKDN